MLFVGGDPAAFYRTDLDLACLEPRWSCRHVTTADEAVVESTSHPVDAIVIDGHLKDAGKVLDVAEKLARHPICLVRRNLLDRADSARWSRAGLTHISDGADAATLAASLNRAARLREWMADPAIKKLLPLIRKLPIASKLHADITRELESASGSTVAVAALVSEDPVIAAKILQLVNSAYFGLPHEITDMAEAVMVLGTERLRSLILLAGAFSQYEGALCPGFSSQAIWSHSLKTGTIARAIALAQTRDSRIAEAAFTAGLVHDLGKLVLAANQPALYEAVLRLHQSGRMTFREAELQVLGITHAELGACLLAGWGLPLCILEAVAWHHQPLRSADRAFSLLTAVHGANLLAHEADPAAPEDGEAINLEYLARIGLGDCRNRCRDFCGALALERVPDPAEQVVRRREAKEN